MNKKLFLLTLVAALLLTLTGCIRIGPRSISIGSDTITGTGPMVTRNIDVTDFTSIDVTGNFIVVYNIAPETALTVVMQENLFSNLETNIRGDDLQVSNRNIIVSGTGNRPRLYVYAPYLTAVSFSGALDVQDWDIIQGQSFTIDASGAVNIDITVDVHSLDVDASGAVNLTLEMNADTLDMDISGAADVNVSGFARNIDINGSGAFNLRAGDLIIEGGSVDVAGASNVYLSTLDNVTINTSGLSRVRGAS